MFLDSSQSKLGLNSSSSTYKEPSDTSENASKNVSTKSSQELTRIGHHESITGGASGQDRFAGKGPETEKKTNGLKLKV